MHKKTSLAIVIAAATLAAQQANAAFIEDSKLSIDLRNLYFNSDNRESQNNTDQFKEWGQAFMLKYQSGFTEGTVGFGVDAIGLLGVKLDSGGNGDADDRRLPGTMFPKHNGKAADEFSKAGATAKMRLSKTELHIGTLMPKLPVVTYNDGRLLPQLFEGGQITSKEIDGLTLTAGQLEHTVTRASSDDVGLAINGRTKDADSNKFYFAGGDYKITKNLTAQYYYGNLEEFYKQHFLGLLHDWALPVGTLKTDLRYFYSDSDGNNSSAAGRANGYTSSGYWNGSTSNSKYGEVDNRTWSAKFTYLLKGHELSAGYQKVSGNSNFPFLNQGDGATAYLITDSQIGKFQRSGESTWLAGYAYNFEEVGVPGLRASIVYLSGDKIRSEKGDQKEWERDIRLDYTLQNGPLKGFGVSLRNASLRSQVANDMDENRLYLTYSLQLM